MRHPARVLDQRLHAAQRFGQGEQPGPRADIERRRLAVDVGEGDHPAEVAHLLRRHLVAGVLRQARVEHLRHLGVADQCGDDPLGVGAVPFHPDGEGLDAAQRQEGVERPGHRARSVLQERDLLGQFVVGGDHDAAHHVGVPAQVLGGRVHHDVRAEFQRLLQVWRGEGVVHDQLRARVAGNLRQGGDVTDVEQRIGGRLDPDQLGVRLDRRPHCVHIGHWGGGVLDSPAGKHLVHQPERAAVGVVRNDQVVAGPQGGAQHRVGGRHAGRERAPMPTAFQRGQTFLQRGAGRVAGAGVLVTGAHAAHPVLGVGRRGVDGHDHRTGRRVCLLARMNGAGGEAVTHVEQSTSHA